MFVYLFNNLPYADFEKDGEEHDIPTLQDRIDFPAYIEKKCKGKFSNDLIDLLK